MRLGWLDCNELGGDREAGRLICEEQLRLSSEPASDGNDGEPDDQEGVGADTVTPAALPIAAMSVHLLCTAALFRMP